MAVCSVCLAARAPERGVFATFTGNAGASVTSVAADRAGNTYVTGTTASSDLPVTRGALQTTFGGSTDAYVAKLGPDRKLIWCTYLGGGREDAGSGVAVDQDGNVIVAGTTNSIDFPGGGGSGNSHHIFVVKFDSNGAKLKYSDIIGADSDDFGIALALDTAGSAYVAASTNFGYPDFLNSPAGMLVVKVDAVGSMVYTFLHPRGQTSGIAVDAAGSAYVVGTVVAQPSDLPTFGVKGYSDAIVFKLSPDGSRKEYETTIGGTEQTQGLAIAVDASGAAYLAGTTDSVDYPLVAPLQSTFGARPLWKSNDAGATWTPIDDLPFAYLSQLAVDPVAPGTLYAAVASGVATLPVGGLFKSTDGGSTWTRASSGMPPTSVQSIAVDPRNSAIIYAGAVSGGADAVYRSTDGAETWKQVDSGAGNSVQVNIDGGDSRAVYAHWDRGCEGRRTRERPGPRLHFRAMAWARLRSIRAIRPISWPSLWGSSPFP